MAGLIEAIRRWWRGRRRTAGGWSVPGAWELHAGERARYTIVVLEEGEGAAGRILAQGKGTAQFYGYLGQDHLRAILDKIGQVVNVRGIG